MLERSKEWVEADLMQLIAIPVSESISLDYKVAAALAQQDGIKREIAKDVSAFANSAGGILVYGMREQEQNPTQIDPVNPQPFSSEWLENVIISNVQPRIEGLHINPILLAGANAGRVIYAVTIPQSYTAHQSADHRYYKRFNFQSVPMEHFEVLDTMNRGKTPIIDVRFQCRLEKEDRDRDAHCYQVLVWLDNKGAIAAKNIKLLLAVPVPLRPESGGLHRGQDQVIQTAAGRQYRQMTLWTVYNNAMIFPSDSTHIGAHGCTYIST